MNPGAHPGFLDLHSFAPRLGAAFYTVLLKARIAEAKRLHGSDVGGGLSYCFIKF